MRRRPPSRTARLAWLVPVVVCVACGSGSPAPTAAGPTAVGTAPASSAAAAATSAAPSAAVDDLHGWHAASGAPTEAGKIGDVVTGAAGFFAVGDHGPTGPGAAWTSPDGET